MESLSGIKLLSAAMMFGGAAVVFTTVPFVLVIVRGIMKARDKSTGGGNFLGVVLLAFIVHVVSTVAFMATILVLDVFGKMNRERFFSETVLGIFWKTDKTSAFAAAGITESSSNEALGAWTTLYTVKTVVDLFFICIPVIVIAGAMAYGISLSTKDTYRQDNLTVIVYSGISMTAAMFLYMAWAMIATQGLFLPYDYNGLLGYIGSTWTQLLM
ncbi:MAG: hypothetical protein LBJ88_04145 [Campylobacteraceae bacterium]|jgi:hypothetical protein|nr:hypothetical protein [Campylobacteraceae bacterium]